MMVFGIVLACALLYVFGSWVQRHGYDVDLPGGEWSDLRVALFALWLIVGFVWSVYDSWSHWPT